MKKLKNMLYINFALFTLIGCSNSEESKVNSPKNIAVLDEKVKDIIETDKNTWISNIAESSKEESSNVSSEESVNTNLGKTSSVNRELNGANEENKEILSQYSNNQIEYAQVWLQLGQNQKIDELNILQIPAGTPLNPNDDTSAKYPEDVIQLSGSRLLDGSVTFSRNGDGTINVYNVPLRWDGQYPAGENFYIDMIKNTKVVYVNPLRDEKIVELIKIQK